MTDMMMFCMRRSFMRTIQRFGSSDASVHNRGSLPLPWPSRVLLFQCFPALILLLSASSSILVASKHGQQHSLYAFLAAAPRGLTPLTHAASPDRIRVLLPKENEQEYAEAQNPDESVEKGVNAEQSAEGMNAERSTEEVNAEQSAEDVNAQQSAAEVQAENSTEEVNAGKSAKEVNAGESAEEVNAEQSAEEVNAERSAEEVNAEQSAGEVDAEQSAGEVNAGESGEGMNAGESAAEAKAESSAAEVNAEQSAAEVNAEDVNAEQSGAEAQAENSAEEVNAGESAAEAKAGSSAAKVNAEQPAEVDAEQSAEEVNAGESAAEAKAESSAAKVNAEQPAEEGNAEESAAEVNAEQPAEVDAEQSAEEGNAGESAAEVNAELSAEEVNAENSAEDVNAEQSEAEVQAEKSVAEVNAGNSAEDVNAEQAEVQAENSADEVNAERSAAEVNAENSSQEVSPEESASEAAWLGEAYEGGSELPLKLMARPLHTDEQYSSDEFNILYQLNAAEEGGNYVVADGGDLPYDRVKEVPREVYSVCYAMTVDDIRNRCKLAKDYGEGVYIQMQHKSNYSRFGADWYEAIKELKNDTGLNVSGIFFDVPNWAELRTLLYDYDGIFDVVEIHWTHPSGVCFTDIDDSIREGISESMEIRYFMGNQDPSVCRSANGLQYDSDLYINSPERQLPIGSSIVPVFPCFGGTTGRCYRAFAEFTEEACDSSRQRYMFLPNDPNSGKMLHLFKDSCKGLGLGFPPHDLAQVV